MLAIGTMHSTGRGVGNGADFGYGEIYSYDGYGIGVSMVYGRASGGGYGEGFGYGNGKGSGEGTGSVCDMSFGGLGCGDSTVSLHPARHLEALEDKGVDQAMYMDVTIDLFNCERDI